MENHFHDYKLFFDFIETYIHNGFSGIDTEDPLMMDLEQMMAENDQFIYLADAIHMKILYVSKRSNEMMGIRPEDLSFYHFMEATHPD
ncbi:MAG: hypothetical protein V2I47_12570, partial [Bacteroidales bacterium]|nr:hypothetical protein [Bacteroidales bacterium]